MPLGPRSRAEFGQAQREGRLKLQEALAERQRVRDSVLTLKHAQVGLGPIIVERHASALGRSPTWAVGGAAGGAMNLLQFPTLNHASEITPGIMEPDCRSLLQTFFQEKRKPTDGTAQ